MAKRRTFSGPNPFEQGEKSWLALQGKFEQTVSTSFGGSMRKAQQRSVAMLDSMVYVSGTHKANKRGGNLRRSEKLFLRGTSATIENAAGSSWKGTKTCYALIIAKGRAARVKASGMYAYMLDAYQRRPDTLEGWLEAVRAGLAVLTKKMGAMKAKPWRKRAIEAAKREGLFVQEYAKNIQEANEEAAAAGGAR